MRAISWVISLIFLSTLVSSGQTVTFQLHADGAELNGAVVTPAVGPAGALVSSGTGSVNFAPAVAGSGVYFLTCCGTSNNAYYKWTGVGLASLFDPLQGQISFDIKSRQAFAVRTGSRYVFDLQDALGTSRLRFTVQKQNGRLIFDWTGKGITNGYWYVPAGAEDQWFGVGVTQHVTLAWAGSTFTTTIGSKTQTNAYAPPAPTWADASIFTVGGRFTSGTGAYVCDDIIGELTVASGSAPPPPPPPVTVPPAFTTSTAVSFTGGIDNGFTITATGTPAPTLSTSGTLPLGVSFDAITGALSGTPATLGVWPIVLTATNSAGTATQNFILTVTPPASASFTCTVVFNLSANNLTITNCPASALVPSSALSNFSLILQLSGLGVEWQIDGTRKYVMAAGSTQ